jgi:hypothetical protein
MTARELLQIQMTWHFGIDAKSLLRKTVLSALDEGEWHEDFDLAVTAGELADEDAERLLQAVLRAYPDQVLDLSEIRRIIERHLPQSSLAQLEWLVGPDCALVVTDSLRVAKLASSALVWATRRISWDGIQLHRIENDVVYGSWYDVTNPNDEWQSLRLGYSDGKLLEGREINV